MIRTETDGVRQDFKLWPTTNWDCWVLGIRTNNTCYVKDYYGRGSIYYGTTGGYVRLI